MKPKRVLQYGLTEGMGGVERFVYELYRYIDRDKVQFDFLTRIDGKIAFDNELIERGGCIYKEIIPRRKSLIGSYWSFNKFFESHPGYIAIHQHANYSNYILPLKYAKKYGIKKRIFHAHNSGNMYPASSKIKGVISDTRDNRIISTLGKYATDCFACSNLAAEYMFRGKYKYSIVNDAIDSERFIFSESIRNRMRRELGIGDKFAVGFVGRLQYQKNPEKLLDIFMEIKKLRPDSCLIYVGVGDLYEDLIVQAKKYGIASDVLFLGRRKDVNDILQAFDCYVMPSRFEGLGISYIEAQAAGLPTFGTAETVPQEVKVTNLMHFISQDASAYKWAEEILLYAAVERTNRQSDIIRSGYDIKDVAKKIEKFYLNGSEMV